MKRTLKHWWQAQIAPLEQRIAAARTRKYRPIAQLLRQFVPVGGVILDIGANHGKFAKELARINHGDCVVHCFEPLPYNLEILALTMHKHPNAIVHPIGLSDCEGNVAFTVPYKTSGRIAAGSAGLGPVDGAQYSELQTESITVPVTTLDRWMQTSPAQRIDLIKIDVEGAELKIFRGGAQTIQRCKPAIYAELGRTQSANFGLRPETTINKLSDWGYRMYNADPNGSGIRPTECIRDGLRDYLFLADPLGADVLSVDN